MNKSPQFYAEVKAKREIMFDRYGGMMSLKDLTKELGFGSVNTTKKWVEEVGLSYVRVTGHPRFETDIVAREIVRRRVC